MAVCLDYQSIYSNRREGKVSMRLHLGAALLLLAALGVKVWIKVVMTDVGYELAAERRHAIELDMEKRELTLQRSVLFRPDQLSKMASERLDLQPYNPSQVRRIVNVSKEEHGE
jgi:predicted site-specific integrase-resolvase